MQSEQETLSGNHDQGSRDQPWKYLQDFALRSFLSGLPSEKPLVLWGSAGEVSSSASPLPLAQLIQCPAKWPGAHQARKEILLSLWLAEEVARETTGKYCLHVALGSFPCARDSLLCSCTILLHRLLQAALGPCWKATHPSCFFVQLTLLLLSSCVLSDGTVANNLAHFLSCCRWCL